MRLRLLCAECRRAWLSDGPLCCAQCGYEAQVDDGAVDSWWYRLMLWQRGPELGMAIHRALRHRATQLGAVTRAAAERGNEFFFYNETEETT